MAMKKIDIYILCDTTGSMGTYVSSLVSTIEQISAMVRLLLPKRARISVVSYKDYCEGVNVCTYAPIGSSESELNSFINGLKPDGGGDLPEATKTGLHKILDMIKEAGETKASDHGDTINSHRSIVIHYTDAPPHCEQSKSSGNIKLEREALKNKKPGFDWIAICKAFIDLNVPVFTFITDACVDMAKICMTFLGKVIPLKNTSPYSVTKATIGMLMHILGENFAFNDEFSLIELEDQSKYSFDIIKNETLAGGFPRITLGHELKYIDKPFKFDLVDNGIKIDDDILQNFTKDEAYKDIVFAVMAEMLTPDCCLSLTYNPILGKLWRLCCKQRGDSRLDDLRGSLSKSIYLIKNKDHKQQMKDWLEESYNAKDQIKDWILSQQSQTPCLMIDPVAELGDVDHEVARDTLRSLARAPLPAALAIAQKLMTHLIVVNEGSESLLESHKVDFVPRYLPLSLNDSQLFGCLPHLLYPGMLFSQRPALMMAVVAVICESKYLVGRARSFLDSRKGKWLNLCDVEKIPEVLAEESVKLLSQSALEEFLTEEEFFVYKRLDQIARLRITMKKEFGIKVAHLPDIKNVYPDYKFVCKSCNHYRSFTLMCEDGNCGLCVQRLASEDYEVVGAQVESLQNASRLAHCRKCLAIYEVVKVDDLKVTPKCHFCRNNLSTKTITCMNCKNIFINSADLFRGKEADWMCSLCSESPGRSFDQPEVLAKELVEGAPKIIECLGFEDGSLPLLIDHVKNFKIFTQHWDTFTKEPMSNLSLELFHKRQTIFNACSLVSTIKDYMKDGNFFITCLLCFEDVSLKKSTESPCGFCKNRVCFNCIRKWVNQIQPGKVVLPSSLVCPFCKNIPKKKIFEEFNKRAKTLFHKEHLKTVVARMVPKTYYGWCQGCAKIKIIGPYACNAEVPFSENENDFLCEDCSVMNALDIRTCPGCQAPTTKSYGCNHIHCPVCDTHWCYVCNVAFDECDIYDHLIEVHGNIGIEEIHVAVEE